MIDHFGTPTSEALREADALCPGSEPIAEERLAAVSRRDLVLKEAAPWLAFVGISIAVGWGFVCLNAPHPARGAVKASGLALPAMSYPSVGSVLQSSGGALAWVKVDPSNSAWVPMPRLAPSPRRTAGVHSERAAISPQQKEAPGTTKFFSSWDECFRAGGASVGASMFGDCNLYCTDREYKRLGRIGKPSDPLGACATITYGVASAADLAQTRKWLCRRSESYQESHRCP